MKSTRRRLLARRQHREQWRREFESLTVKVVCHASILWHRRRQTSPSMQVFVLELDLRLLRNSQSTHYALISRTT
jgi:hypothetical protein